LFFGFAVVGVVNAAINGADCSALGLVMKAHALGAFVSDDVIDIHADGVVFGISIGSMAVQEVKTAFETRSVRVFPLQSTFVNGVVGALRFASTAVDTLVSNHDSHGSLFLILAANIGPPERAFLLPDHALFAPKTAV
jgi:hypothetical protein